MSSHAEARTDGHTLLLASSGGHLQELVELRQRLCDDLGPHTWATFETAQSRDLLAGEDVVWLPYVEPRDLRGAVANLPYADRLLRSGDYARVVTTGAGVAVPFLLRARTLGLHAHYIESAARSEGPSLSGRVARRIGKVHLYTQYAMWARGPWQFRGSIFDRFVPAPFAATGPVDRVVVTFGTQRGFGFRRAAERLVALLPQVTTSSPTVLWQTGATDVDGLPIEGVETVSADELHRAVAEADLVVSHAGVGACLVALESGRCPVLLPRRKDLSEHTDDHQRFIAAELTERRLAVSAEPECLTPADLLRASRMRVESIVAPPPFLLQPD